MNQAMIVDNIEDLQIRTQVELKQNARWQGFAAKNEFEARAVEKCV